MGARCTEIMVQYSNRLGRILEWLELCGFETPRNYDINSLGVNRCPVVFCVFSVCGCYGTTKNYHARYLDRAGVVGIFCTEYKSRQLRRYFL